LSFFLLGTCSFFEYNSASLERRNVVALVLCTGVDPVLLETRKLILQQAGHKVITTRSEPELAAACEANRFDVAVIGQTVTPRMKQVISTLVRQHCPTAKVLELYYPYQGKALDNADSWLEVPAAVPRDLAQKVNELVNV
jgi:hypothetical protein